MKCALKSLPTLNCTHCTPCEIWITHDHPAKHVLTLLPLTIVKIGCLVSWSSRMGNPGARGALTCQRYMGMCHFDDPPFLGSSTAPETHLFIPSVSSYALHFLKNSAFLGPFFSDFGKISAPNTLILAKICSQDSNLSRKTLFC